MISRNLLKSFIEHTGMIITGCFYIMFMIVISPILFLMAVFTIPFGLFEWATKEQYGSSKYYNHPIGYLMDKIFPEENIDSFEE